MRRALRNSNYLLLKFLDFYNKTIFIRKIKSILKYLRYIFARKLLIIYKSSNQCFATSCIERRTCLNVCLGKSRTVQLRISPVFKGLSTYLKIRRTSQLQSPLLPSISLRIHTKHFSRVKTKYDVFSQRFVSSPR